MRQLRLKKKKEEEEEEKESIVSSSSTFYHLYKMGEGHDFLGQGQGEGEQISLPLQGWVTSFPNPNLKFPPPPLLISVKDPK